jgi:hypothetical protein
VWIILLKVKYSKLLTKNLIRDNIYCEGTVSIFKFLKYGLHVILVLIPIIILTIFVCRRKTLLVSIELPQKITLYVTIEWKYARYIILRIYIVHTVHFHLITHFITNKMHTFSLVLFWNGSLVLVFHDFVGWTHLFLLRSI